MEKAKLSLQDARRSFNLGVGMVLIVRKERAPGILEQLAGAGETPWIMGELVKGEGAVRYS
jgi:phosphoribosylformylglycinamidine cyclo-ligase